MVQQALRAYLAAGLEDALIVQAMREAAEHDVKATLPYIRSILDRCQAQGIHCRCYNEVRQKEKKE